MCLPNTTISYFSVEYENNQVRYYRAHTEILTTGKCFSLKHECRGQGHLWVDEKRLLNISSAHQFSCVVNILNPHLGSQTFDLVLCAFLVG